MAHLGYGSRIYDKKRHLVDARKVKAMETSLIIEYANLLHQYRDPNAEAVKKFLENHSSDSVFLKRARVLNKVFKLKQELVSVSNTRLS